MTIEINTPAFAIAQTGYAVFGFGATEAEAWENAAEWAEGVEGLECLPCTAEAFEAGCADAVCEYDGMIVTIAQYEELTAD